MNGLLTVYATKLPDQSVRITREDGTEFCRFDKYRSDRPTRRNRYITLNCYRWNLVWIA